MKIVIVGFNQYQKKALIYRQIDCMVEPEAIMKAGKVFYQALKKGATIISTRVLEEKEYGS